MNREQMDSTEILRKAVERAASGLGLSREQFEHVLGCSISAPSGCGFGVGLDSKSSERALVLIRIYQSLCVLVGADVDEMRAWMQTENRYFQTTPVQHIQRVDGMLEVMNYLEGMRVAQ